MADPFLGEIRMFAGSYSPRGWAHCDGQLLSIQQNAALFSLLGTTYGGNGSITFGLPDLRGRVPVHRAGPGGPTTQRNQGQPFGQDTVLLTTANLPAHSHAASSASTQTSDRTGTNLAPAPGGSYGTATQQSGMAPGQVVGNNVPFDNAQPSLAVGFIIALEGIYPSRD
ncbi:phage tail protein [Arthrobacter sp. HLT1-20]